MMSPQMDCPLATESPPVRETVNALVTELVTNGADLRCVSLDEMKRRLTTALRKQRGAAMCSGRT